MTVAHNTYNGGSTLKPSPLQCMLAATVICQQQQQQQNQQQVSCLQPSILWQNANLVQGLQIHFLKPEIHSNLGAPGPLLKVEGGSDMHFLSLATQEREEREIPTSTEPEIRAKKILFLLLIQHTPPDT